MTSTERLYLAGPMTGMPEWNFPAFHAATDRLRERGHIVCNPAERDAEVGFHPAGMTGHEDLAELGFNLRQAMAYDLEWITTQATRVVVLDGWERSKGARAEVAAATAIGIEVHALDAFLMWGTEARDLTAPSADPVVNVLHVNGDVTVVRDIGSVGETLRSTSPQPRPQPQVETLPPIIGITGRKRSGKNTAADALVAMGYELGGFADELKDAALQLNPWIFDDKFGVRWRLSCAVGAYGWEWVKDHFPEARRILQRLGTDVVRERDPEFWLEAFERRYGAVERLVIADVRFDNEAQWIRDRGGILLEVVRPDQFDDGDSHASESGVSHELIDAIIANDGGVERLHYRMRTCITARSKRAA